MDNVDKEKQEAFDSAPEIHKKQVPKNRDTIKELLSGDSENDAGMNNLDTIFEEDVNSRNKKKIISAKMRRFGKGFVIPDDKTSNQ